MRRPPLTSALARERMRFTCTRPLYSCARVGAHLVVGMVSGRRVLAGPFEGMRYRIDWPHLPILVGTYELEIQPAIEALSGTAFSRMVNIGAGDGYYAVGLARRWPDAEVFAFESSADRRARIARVARDNAVADRVRIRGTCGLDDLRRLLEHAGPTLLFVDVEGAESTLLDPGAVPALARAWVLVEVHDHLVPGVSQAVSARFADTHRITCCRSRPRSPDDWPLELLAPRWLTRRFALFAMRENRATGQAWLLFQPRAGALSPGVR